MFVQGRRQRGGPCVISGVPQGFVLGSHLFNSHMFFETQINIDFAG